MDVVLMPDQMMLQIHESIGHPLELDRILGDERNYAGTSFVTLGHVRQLPVRLAAAERHVRPDPRQRIRELRLRRRRHAGAQRTLPDPGAACCCARSAAASSQARARAAAPTLAGVATARACAWNRPPIDRMSNSTSSRARVRSTRSIAATELGVLMKTNRSWSIDDSRNKFQFGCEWRQHDPRRAGSPKWCANPNYRGVSRDFWRSLAMVGAARRPSR